MVTPCINIIQHFNFQLTHTTLKNVVILFYTILKCFNNSTFCNVVCISWKLKCWISGQTSHQTSLSQYVSQWGTGERKATQTCSSCVKTKLPKHVKRNQILLPRAPNGLAWRSDCRTRTTLGAALRLPLLRPSVMSQEKHKQVVEISI